jgi:hypothetical protein
MIRVLLLVLALLVPSAAQAGFQNILFELKDYPADGYVLGESGTLKVITQWEGQPLPNMPVYITMNRPAPNGWFESTWLFRTNGNGVVKVPLEFTQYDYPGTWYVSGFLGEPLPDGTWDGESTTFVVQE